MKLLILVFLSLSIQAQVIQNKGPYFSVEDSSQKDIIDDYITFKMKNYALDKYKVKGLEFSFFKNSSKDNFRLPKRGFDSSNYKQNSLGFGYKYNNEYETWGFTTIEYGFCMGFTTLLRKFHYFASYDASKVAPYNKETQLEQWSKYYQELIDKVMRNEKVVFPGFASLYELSRSSLHNYFRRHVADQWAIQNINFSGVLSWYMPPSMNKKEVKKFKGEIDFYLSRNFEPIVMMYTNERQSEGIHVTRAIKTSEINTRGCFNITILETSGREFREWEVCPDHPQDVYRFASNEKAYFSEFYHRLKQ